jgi:hypothetical protein
VTFDEAEVRRIYALNGYASGCGSTVETTGEIAAELPRIVKSFGIQSLFDCPCGDRVWIRHVDLAGIRYVGADVLDALIERHRQMWPDLTFLVLNAVVQAPPEAFNLILCRDFLFHLCNADIAAVLNHFRQSGSQWLLTTTFKHDVPPADLRGREMEIGWGWRPINVAHFGLTHPVLEFQERHPVCRGRYMGLYEIQS